MVDFDDLPTSGVLHYDGYSQINFSLNSYAGGHNRGAIYQAPSIGASLRKDVYAAFHKMISFSKLLQIVSVWETSARRAVGIFGKKNCCTKM